MTTRVIDTLSPEAQAILRKEIAEEAAEAAKPKGPHPQLVAFLDAKEKERKQKAAFLQANPGVPHVISKQGLF